MASEQHIFLKMVLSEGSGKVLLVSTRLFQEVSETIYKLKTFRIFWPGRFRAFAMSPSPISKRYLMIRKFGLGTNYLCVPDQYLSDLTAHSYLLQEVHREAEANKVQHSACIQKSLSAHSTESLRQKDHSAGFGTSEVKIRGNGSDSTRYPRHIQYTSLPPNGWITRLPICSTQTIWTISQAKNLRFLSRCMHRLTISIQVLLS
jgi:hypothetical protein